jgi:hypothetical protein
MTLPLLTVHDLARDHVVVELHEALTEPLGGLGLQVALPRDREGAVAWWMDEWVRFVWRVAVAEA